MDIRRGAINEINDFNSFSVDNVGETIEICESGGQIVGYMMRTGSTVYYIESDAKGAGRAMIDSLKAQFEYVAADNVQKTAEPFWTAMGFRPEPEMGRGTWTWYEGE